MKILQLISSNGFFGAENVLVQLAEALSRKVGITVITGVIENSWNPHIEVGEESQKRGIEAVVFPCGSRFDLGTVRALQRCIRERKIDVIHSHGYKSNIFAALASFNLPVALVSTCHNWPGDYPKMRLYAVLDRFFLRRFHKIVAVSTAVEKKILASGLPQSRVSIIRNGIDVERFGSREAATGLKARLGISPDHLVIGTVGRLSSEKGHRHLLNVARQIQAERPDTSFLVVGDGILGQQLRDEYGSQSGVIFTGLRDDIPELYRCMDIFVLPSLTEGLPMVLLEAMASALPVVATRVGSVPELVPEGEAGYLVISGEEEPLRDALMRLINESRDARTTMGERGAERVSSEYSSARMAENYLSVYKEALKQGEETR